LRNFLAPRNDEVRAEKTAEAAGARRMAASGWFDGVPAHACCRWQSPRAGHLGWRTDGTSSSRKCRNKIAFQFLAGCNRLLYNKYYVDQILRCDVRESDNKGPGAHALEPLTLGVINGLGRGTGAGWLTPGLRRVFSMAWDSWIVDGLGESCGNGVVWGLELSGGGLLQTGRVSRLCAFSCCSACLIFLGLLFALFGDHASKTCCTRRRGRADGIFTNTHILSVVLFTPLVGSVVAAVRCPRENSRKTRNRVIGNLLPLSWG